MTDSCLDGCTARPNKHFRGQLQVEAHVQQYLQVRVLPLLWAVNLSPMVKSKMLIDSLLIIELTPTNNKQRIQNKTPQKHQSGMRASIMIPAYHLTLLFFSIQSYLYLYTLIIEICIQSVNRLTQVWSMV